VVPLIPGVTWLEAAMMGRQNSDQASLFYAFRLDARVPMDHLLRRIDVFVTAGLGGMHARLKPYYSEIGRPSLDPELMIRMLIIGYCYGPRSERRLTQEVDLHSAYPWFCRIDLDDKVPHHSTFSENRLHRFRESDMFRYIFERIVTACMAAGLVKGGFPLRRFHHASRAPHRAYFMTFETTLRKQAAPASSARARTLSSGKAVMKMIGNLWPWVCRRFCSSIPLIPGI
jgi:transposase